MLFCGGHCAEPGEPIGVEEKNLIEQVVQAGWGELWKNKLVLDIPEHMPPMGYNEKNMMNMWLTAKFNAGLINKEFFFDGMVTLIVDHAPHIYTDQPFV